MRHRRLGILGFMVVLLLVVALPGPVGATNTPPPEDVQPLNPIPITPACNDTLGGSTDRDQDGVGVLGTCWGNSASAPGWQNVSSAAVWNFYGCNQWQAYSPGSIVSNVSYNGGSPESSELFLEDIVDRGLDPTVTYHWHIVECEYHPPGDPDAVEYWSWGLLVIGSTPPVDPIDMRDTARARINPAAPTPMSSPMWTDVPSLVHVPTWLWIPEGEWQPEEESESVGFVTVVVQARPEIHTWDMGDGTTVTCENGPGVPWAAGMDDSETYCSHTYTSSSLGYQADVTVTWVFYWWLNGNFLGEFERFDVSTSLDFPVAEIQAIESS